MVSGVLRKIANKFGRKKVSIFKFKRWDDNSMTQSHEELMISRKDLLKKVEEWWDCVGTGQDDYDGIQIKVQERA